MFLWLPKTNNTFNEHGNSFRFIINRFNMHIRIELRRWPNEHQPNIDHPRDLVCFSLNRLIVEETHKCYVECLVCHVCRSVCESVLWLSKGANPYKDDENIYVLKFSIAPQTYTQSTKSRNKSSTFRTWRQQITETQHSVFRLALFNNFTNNNKTKTNNQVRMLWCACVVYL